MVSSTKFFLETKLWQLSLVVIAATKYRMLRGFAFIAGCQSQAIQARQKSGKSVFYLAPEFYFFPLYFHGSPCGADIRRH
jgi:hypothetical protein